jgi:ribosome-associated protein
MTRKRHLDRAGAAAPSEADLPDEPLYDRPSKSQLKRDMLALQVLGKDLAELPKEAFRKLPLPEDLLEALTETRKISDHEGRRRQLQFVGKVMRRLDDEEVAAIRATLDVIRGVSRAETVKLHAIERWRDQLIGSDQALTDFLVRYPGVNVQEGRTLIRNARREAERKGSPRYFRELFQWVKNAIVPPSNKLVGGAAASAQSDDGDEHEHEHDSDEFATEHTFAENDFDEDEDDDGEDDDASEEHPDARNPRSR